MQDLRAFFTAQLFQNVHQLFDVVAVDGAGVVKAEVFKQRQRLLGVLGFARREDR